jgi:hypothetical protein
MSTRNIESITDKEIDKFFEVSGIDRGEGLYRLELEEIKVFVVQDIPEHNKDYNIRKTCRNEESEVILGNCKGLEIRFNSKEVYMKEGEKTKPIPNPFQVAQYLIDQGFRFNYNKD